jgi:hypothetical protein
VRQNLHRGTASELPRGRVCTAGDGWASLARLTGGRDVTLRVIEVERYRPLSAGAISRN